MKVGLQFGAWLCGFALGAAMILPCAEAQSKDRPPARQQAQPSRPPQNNRPSGSYHPQNAPRGRDTNRQPDNRRLNQDGLRGNDPRAYGRDSGRGSNANQGRPNDVQRNDRLQNQYRSQTPAVPPPSVRERLRNMSPQERQKLAQRQEQFRRLPPQKQQEMRQAAENWSKLTPEQQNHIKNDLSPRWQQMSPERRKAISNRLAVLQNMPESARNRHLSDPNFTRGMSDEDKQMLRDLSHEHVGAPDQRQEQ
jgi:hypothetical protein